MSPRMTEVCGEVAAMFNGQLKHLSVRSDGSGGRCVVKEPVGGDHGRVVRKSRRNHVVAALLGVACGRDARCGEQPLTGEQLEVQIEVEASSGQIAGVW